jgi:hypothetical protein
MGTYEDNFKMDLKETGCRVQDGDQCRFVAITLMKLMIPLRSGIY